MGWSRWPPGFIPNSSRRVRRQSRARELAERMSKLVANIRSGRERLTPRRLAVALAILTAALLLIFVIAISIGSEHVALGDIGRIIIAKIGGRSASVLAEP